MPDSFIDTNVLVHFASSDAEKCIKAERLIDEGGVISVQVLNELANVARRKMKLTWPETRSLLTTVSALLAVVPITIETHETGLRLAERLTLSIYDSMIAAAALQANCTTLWSEDMHDGLLIENRLRIKNPFKA